MPEVVNDGPTPAKRKRRAPIDERVRTFIKGLLDGKPVTEAGADAGYATVREINGLLRRKDVREAISVENRARDRVLRHTPAKIESQLGDLAFSDIGALFDDQLKLRPLSEMAPEARAAIAGITTQEFHDLDGKVTRRIYKVQLERKQPALDSLSKIHGMVDDGNFLRQAGFEINIHLNTGPGESSPNSTPAIDITPEQPPGGTSRLPESDPDPSLN